MIDKGGKEGMKKNIATYEEEEEDFTENYYFLCETKEKIQIIGRKCNALFFSFLAVRKLKLQIKTTELRNPR